MFYIASMTTRAPLVEIQFVGRVMVMEGEVWHHIRVGGVGTQSVQGGFPSCL